MMTIKEVVKNLQKLLDSDILPLLAPSFTVSVEEAIKYLQDDEDIIKNFRTFREE